MVEAMNAVKCWLFVGSLDAKGYGRCNHKGKSMKAHRLSWILNNGDIPPGMGVLHSCDVRNCINPDHLFLGTQKDNMQDCARKRRFAKQHGEYNATAKLTELQVLEIRASTQTSRLVGDLYGVADCTVRAIRQRRLWSHI